jgi:hypothetical protein
MKVMGGFRLLSAVATFWKIGSGPDPPTAKIGFGSDGSVHEIACARGLSDKTASAAPTAAAPRNSSAVLIAHDILSLGGVRNPPRFASRLPESGRALDGTPHSSLENSRRPGR